MPEAGYQVMAGAVVPPSGQLVSTTQDSVRREELQQYTNQNIRYLVIYSYIYDILIPVQVSRRDLARRRRRRARESHGWMAFDSAPTPTTRG